jgi:hypothetical protein
MSKVDTRIPDYWTNPKGVGARRLDGVVLNLEPRGDAATAEIGWRIKFPAAKHDLMEWVPLSSATTARAAMKKVDVLWPPPSWLDVPNWWLTDLERLAAVENE